MSSPTKTISNCRRAKRTASAAKGAAGKPQTDVIRPDWVIVIPAYPPKKSSAENPTISVIDCDNLHARISILVLIYARDIYVSGRPDLRSPSSHFSKLAAGTPGSALLKKVADNSGLSAAARS